MEKIRILLKMIWYNRKNYILYLVCNIFKNGYLRKGFPGKQITTKKQVPRHFLTETKKYDILVLKKRIL